MHEEMIQVHNAVEAMSPGEMAERITTVFNDTFSALIARREAALAAAIAPLDEETKSLRQEYAAIEETAHSLELLLPAKARVAQAEADKFTLAEKPAEAALKLEEMREAERAPEAMRSRQQELANRINTIEENKRDVAKRVFDTWYAECQSIVRSAERGLFIVLLDGLRDSFLDFESRACPPRDVANQMVRSFHIVDLTADVKSPEWQSGQKWYKGRR